MANWGKHCPHTDAEKAGITRFLIFAEQYERTHRSFAQGGLSVFQAYDEFRTGKKSVPYWDPETHSFEAICKARTAKREAEKKCGHTLPDSVRSDR